MAMGSNTTFWNSQLGMASKEIDVFNVSFIDLLSCALGGVLLILFLVSGLLRDGIKESIEAAKGSGATNTSTNLLSGEVIPPPEPLLFVATIDDKTTRPLNFFLIPPDSTGESRKITLADDEAASAFLQQLRDEKIALSAQNPVVVFPHSSGGPDTRYRALFSRTTNRDGNVVLNVMLPNSRSLEQDARLKSEETLKSEVEWSPNLNGWMLAVEYPGDDSPELTRLLSELSKSWRALDEMNFVFRSLKGGKTARYPDVVKFSDVDWTKPDASFFYLEIDKALNVSRATGKFATYQPKSDLLGNEYITHGYQSVSNREAFEDDIRDEIFQSIVEILFEINLDFKLNDELLSQRLFQLHDSLDELVSQELSGDWDDKNLKAAFESIRNDDKSLVELIDELRRVRRKFIGVEIGGAVQSSVNVDAFANTIPGGIREGSQVETLSPGSMNSLSANKVIFIEFKVAQ